MPTKEEVIAKVHEAENETLESGALSTQVAEFIATSKTESAAQIQTLKDALAAAETRVLTEAEAAEAGTALDGIIAGQNTLQAVLTAAITPAEVPLPPPEEPPVEGTAARSRRR